MPRPPSFQWYPKQWLGDDKVLAMDWDARAMHFHLINLAWQQDPPCSLPDDMDAIRRWLGLPLGSVDSDQTWRRVRPQIFAAWSLRDDRRWYQLGLVRVWERLQRRSQAGTNNVRKRYQSHEVEEEVGSDLDSKKSESKAKPRSIREIAAYCEIRHNNVNPERFWDFYESKGWKVGNQAMKSWQAAVRTWEHNDHAGNGKHDSIPACPECQGNGTTVDGTLCNCPRGQEAATARKVMAKVAAMPTKAKR